MESMEWNGMEKKWSAEKIEKKKQIAMNFLPHLRVMDADVAIKDHRKMRSSVAFLSYCPVGRIPRISPRR
uniref:Uncharacterized protein n=1 Tax=Caenorhabditis japonica TaxID=281687 RepID=A0A8R1E875_CAEJA